MKNITNIGAHVVADETIKLRLRCVAYSAGSYHYADAVLVSAATLTLSIDGTADSTVGASGVIDLTSGSYDTLGELVDAINLSSNWEAEIVAGLRSDTVNGSELLARTTSTFKMFEEVDIKADSSDNGVYGLSFLLEPGMPFETIHGLDSQQSYHQNRVGLQRIRALCNTNAGEVISIGIYEVKPDKASAYKTLGIFAGTDNTEKDTGTTDSILFHAGFGNSLLIKLLSTGTGWIDTAAYLDVQGVKEQS